MADEKVSPAATQEVLGMISERDITVGRLSSGWDTDTDFDALPPHLADVGESEAESAELFQGDAEPEEFAEPGEDEFPLFRNALRYFQANEKSPRAVRIDTDKSYEGFGVEKAVRELARRTDDLRAAVEAHAADGHGGKVPTMRVWEEVLGAAEAIKDLKASESAPEAIDKMPQVPFTVPEFAKGAVKCWLDGDAVVVSVRFQMPDGTPRVATMSATPRVNEEDIERWAEDQGYDAMTILGAVPAIATVATGKKLVRDTAEAALEARDNDDVINMYEDDSDPVVLVGLDATNAPLAALMHVQQRAESGDPRAMNELEKLYAVAVTPAGRKIAAPALKEASKRLTKGREEKTLADEYAKLAMFV